MALEYLTRRTFINKKRFICGAPAKNEPQMNADERRFIVPGLCLNWRGAGSLSA